MERKERFSCKCETNASKPCYKLVKELLETLPENVHTIMVLYYLGKMTTKEIGNFLGVSENVITRKFQQARKLLQENHMLLIQEVLGDTQISGNLTESIMRQVAKMKNAR